MTVKPENVYALVVGIEKYRAGSHWDLNGPAKDALKFTNWLLARDVKPEQIQLFLSPLTQNEGVLAEAKSKGLKPAPATREAIDVAIRYKLTNETSRGDLLYVFWGGHGFVTKTSSTTRRLMLADADNNTALNLNFDSLREALSTSAHNCGFKQQNFFIDACANSLYKGLYQTIQAESAELRFSTTGELKKADQFVLFASAEYEVATNESDIGTGRFSRAVLDELQGQSLMPEMREIVERVEVNCNKQNLKLIYWSYEHEGNKDVIDKTNDALRSAFLDQESLALMVRKALNKNLNVISQGASTYNVTIDKLIAVTLELSDVLSKASINEESLGLMVESSLNTKLNHITQNPQTYEATVNKVVHYAVANGEILALVIKALKTKPSNNHLKNFSNDKWQELELLKGASFLNNDLLASLTQALKTIPETEEFEKIVLFAFTQTIPDIDINAPNLKRH